MKKSLLAALCLVALVALPPLATAQRLTGQDVAYSIFAKDVTGGGYTYCKMVGANEDPFGRPIPGPDRIKTTGSSVTIDEVTVGSNPFALVAVGDMIQVKVGLTNYKRAVVTKPSAAQITVDTALDLSAGYAWRYLSQRCGATAADGWFPADLFYQLNVVYDVEILNATSLDVSLECQLAESGPSVIGQRALGSAAVWSDVLTAGVWDQCRVGLKLTGDTGAQRITVLYGRQK